MSLASDTSALFARNPRTQAAMKKSKPTKVSATKAKGGNEPPLSPQARVNEKILGTLREHYKLGQEALKYRQGGGSLADFAAEHGLIERTARMRLAFARQYTKADLARLCKLRRARSSKPLLSGHVTYLLTIEAAVKASKKRVQLTRRDFEQLAADGDWSPAQLHAEIRKEFGGGKKIHGRTYKSEKLPVAVNKAIELASNWQKRSEAAYQLFLDSKGKHEKALTAFEAMLKSSKQWCGKVEKLIGELRFTKDTKAKSRQ